MPAPQVLEEKIRFQIGDRVAVGLDVVHHVAVGHEEVRVAVVVRVQEGGAPPDEEKTGLPEP